MRARERHQKDLHQVTTVRHIELTLHFGLYHLLYFVYVCILQNLLYQIYLLYISHNYVMLLLFLCLRRCDFDLGKIDDRLEKRDTVLRPVYELHVNER